MGLEGEAVHERPDRGADSVSETGNRPRLAWRVYELQLDRVRMRAIATRHRRDGERAELEQLRAEISAVESALTEIRARVDSPLPDMRLTELLQLSAVELEFLWSAVAATADPLLMPHIRELAGSEVRQGMTLALHAILADLDPTAARAMTLAMTPLHPLLKYGLLEANGGDALSARPITVPARLAGFLAGHDQIDEAVLRVGGVIQIDQEPHLDAAQVDAVKQVVQALTASSPMIILIEGPPEVGKRTAAAIAAMALGRSVIQLDTTRLASATSDLERGFMALRRECLLDNALPLVSQIEDLLAPEGEGRDRMRALARMLDDTPIPIILTSTIPGLELGTKRDLLRVAMPIPDVAHRIVLWKQAIDDRSEVDVEQLAVRYRLGAGSIRRAVGTAKMIAKDRTFTSETLLQGVRNGIADRLGNLAQRVEVKQDWNDLVLNADTVDQVAALIARIKHGHLVHEQWGFSTKLPRGLGTAGLFSGPPGTGKTMVAGLIARELDLELYQVDLSKVVSKWVGETEKQLAKIFDAAEAGHALLLFDEADSLFAKRTDVKSAIDRYANLEVNYLLQRIETFGGISILTTNLDTSIDSALRRRLAAHIVFDVPELTERTELWQRLLSPRAPVSPGIKFALLADEFPDMTGANIRNSVLSAAFLAASEGSVITHQHLVRAGRGEYRAMGRVIR